MTLFDPFKDKREELLRDHMIGDERRHKSRLLNRLFHGEAKSPNENLVTFLELIYSLTPAEFVNGDGSVLLKLLHNRRSVEESARRLVREDHVMNVILRGNCGKIRRIEE